METLETPGDASFAGPALRIIEAGKRLFFERGFQNVSTEMLAKEARVSKASLYKYFADMSDVLAAVTEAEAAHFYTPTVVVVSNRDELQQELVRFGTSLMRFLNRREVTRFTQLMYEQARENQAAAQKFYHAAYGGALEYLSAVLKQGQDQGFVKQRLTPDEMATQLLGMWEFIPMVKVQMSVTKKPFPSPKSWAEKCVGTLLD